MTGPDAFSSTIAAARGLAADRRHPFVGTEHLFLAVLEARPDLAGQLERAGMTRGTLESTLLSGIRRGAGDAGPDAAALPLSRLARQAVQEAEARAAAAGRSRATEHDLLAVIATDAKGRVGRALPAGAGALLSRTTEAAPLPASTSRGPAVPVASIRRSGPPRWMIWLLAAVPATIALRVAGAPAPLVFVAACAGVLPLAGLMGEATESLSERTGPTVGGLLNATFGNAAELIIALVALRAGLVDLVKASITGSILGNLLLILGLSCVAAGASRTTVRFSRTNAGMSSAMLALAVVGLVFPALFHALHPAPEEARAELYQSEIVAGILIVTYALSLVFTLRTHRVLFGSAGAAAAHTGPRWSTRTAVIVLGLATAGVVVQSEILVHAVEGVTHQLGLSEMFLGLVIIPLIGNAAEHATAVVVARKGQMDLAFQIALGSSTQIALLVAPILVFAGLAFGASMNLVFPVFQVMALAVATGVVAIITLDGETHWFEGVQLLALYGLFIAAAYFI